MQPIGGKFFRSTGKKNRRSGSSSSRRAGARGSDSWAGIMLRTSGGWRGRSQKFARRARARRVLFANFRLAGPWRVATGLFLVATSVYGVLEGGYVQRSVDYLSRQTSSAVELAGFTVNKLTIEGQSRTSDQDLVRALAITSRQSMLSFDSGAAQGRLETLPWVRHAQVMRLLPSRIHIVIEERAPFAVWQHNGKAHLIDPDGAVIAPVRTASRPDLPLVVGVGAAKEARALFELLAGKSELREQLRAAVRVADRRWNLKLVNGVEIRLPEENVAYAVNKIEQLDKEHGVLSGDIEAVDLRIPDRVTIRLTKDAAARRDAVFTHPRRGAGLPGRDT